MDLDELEEIMTPKDFEDYMDLCDANDEIYTPQWFITEDMKQEIIEKYGLDDPNDPYGMESDEDESDYYEDDY